MTRGSLDSSADLGLALGAAVLALTCAASSTRAPLVAADPAVAAAVEPSPEAQASAPPAVSASAATADAIEPLPPPAAGSTPNPARGARLDGFRAALAELGRNARTAPVVVLWLGDSHTHADFWPHALRAPLQARYGKGGPGFVSLGIKPYRHSLVSVKVDGKWRREPTNPAASARFKDGVFGLSGQRAIPLGADSVARVTLLDGAASGRMRFTLLHRTPSGAKFTLELSGDKPRTISGTAQSDIERVELQGDARSTLTVTGVRGEPELFGLIVESVEPGVVVDTVGINGARAATALAWDAQSFAAQVRARAPSLVVVAYGTNEAASTLAAARYRAHLSGLVGRIAEAAPGVDCVLVGPTDMALPDGTSVPRVAELDQVVESVAAESGCAYFSAARAMGGPGGFTTWMTKSPPLAAQDRVHLTARGYDALGRAMSAALGL